MEKQEEKCCESMKDKIVSKCKSEAKCTAKCGGGMSVYCVGVIGAIIYFVSHATTFWIGVLGVLKAFVWPAFVVYELLGMFYGK